MFNLKIKVLNKREAEEGLQRRGAALVGSLSPIVGQIMQGEMAKRSKFPIKLEVVGNVATVGPDVQNLKEQEEAIEEATKGTSPQFYVQFKLANKDFLTRELKARGVKGVK